MQPVLPARIESQEDMHGDDDCLNAFTIVLLKLLVVMDLHFSDSETGDGAPIPYLRIASRSVMSERGPRVE